MRLVLKVLVVWFAAAVPVALVVGQALRPHQENAGHRVHSRQPRTRSAPRVVPDPRFRRDLPVRRRS